MENKKEIIESLSINERRVLPFLNEKSITKIAKASGLEEVAVMRALEYLNNKKIINLKISSTKVVELGVNGILYKQKGLPERRLLTAISDEKKISLSEAKKSSGLNVNLHRNKGRNIKEGFRRATS
jgi:phenylalanyl-tRNA synthetase alpha chain